MGYYLSGVLALIWLYLVLRCVRLLPWPRAARVASALLLLLAAEYHLVTSHFFGSLASPELPRGALIVLAWAFGTYLLLAMLVLLRDVLGLLGLVLARRVGRYVLRSNKLALALGVLAMALSAFGVWQAIKVPAVKTVQITLPNLPAAFDGYRLVQLSDLHVSRLLPAPWLAAVVAKTNALQPDLIVITGDLEDGTPQARAADVQPYRQLRARDGVLAVPGNHKYYADYLAWMTTFHELGLHMLSNANVVVRRGNDRLAIAGITDRQAKAFAQPQPDLTAALAGIAPGTTTILLSHRPDNAVASARAGVALELAGHTHGGQILGVHWLTQWANRGFVSGWYQVGAMQLYVSNGTGLWNGIALRIGRPAEITQIVLRRAASP